MQRVYEENEWGKVSKRIVTGAPEVLNGCHHGCCKATLPFVWPLFGLRYQKWISSCIIVEYQIRSLPSKRLVLQFQWASGHCGETPCPRCAVHLGEGRQGSRDLWEFWDTGTTLEGRSLASVWGFLLANWNCWRCCESFWWWMLASRWNGTQF